MSWLFAAAYDPFMRRTERACLSDWRSDLLGRLSEPIRAKQVLEIGAGTGANLAHYPRTIERLVLTEPEEHMLARLRRRPEAARAEIVRADSRALPFESASFDAVVSTLVLCSVPDPARTLAEVRRVLRPGGTFLFLEHVAAEGAPRRLRWQARVEPIWRRLAGDCHLTRRTEAAIARAGLTIESLTKESMRRALPIVRSTIRGVATKPSERAEGGPGATIPTQK